MGSSDDRQRDGRCVLSAIQGGYTALHEAILSHYKDVCRANKKMHAFNSFVNDLRCGMSQDINIPDKFQSIQSSQVLDGTVFIDRE